MKNNVLSAFVVFFAVVACLLIIDDLSHNIKTSNQDTTKVSVDSEQKTSENLATLDLEITD